MTGLLKHEFYKLWQSRAFLFFVIALCLANVSRFAYTQHQENIPYSSYQKLQADLDKLPNEGRFAFIEKQTEKIQALAILDQLETLRVHPDQNKDLIDSILSAHPDVEKKYGESYHKQDTVYYTGHLASEEQFLTQVYTEMKTLHDYPAFLESIHKKADELRTIGIFQKDEGFSSRNIEATRQDYQKHRSTPITYGSEKGIRDALAFPITNYLIVLAILIMASLSILQEKEKNLLALLRTSPKGQWQTISAKLVTLILSSALFIFILLASNLLYMQVTCGLGSLNRSLQSLASYSQCAFVLNVGQYLIISFFIKWGASIILILFMVWIALMARHKVSCFALILFVLALQVLLFQMIAPTSSLRILKYLNIMTILQSDVLFQTYLNLNILQNPVSLHLVLFLGCLMLFVLLTGCVYLTYHHQRHLQLQRFSLTLFHQRRIILHLWIQEAYKLLWLQKGILMLLFCVFLQGYQISHTTFYTTSEERIWMQYMEHLERPLTKEKETFVKQEQQRFIALEEKAEELHERVRKHTLTKEQAEVMLAPIEGQLQGKVVFDQIYAMYQSILEEPARQFITPYGYELLVTSSPTGSLTSILFLIFLLLTLANIYGFEFPHDLHRLLAVTKNGRAVLCRYKQRLTLIILLLYALILYIPYVWKLSNVYGLSTLNAAASSLHAYEQLPSFITIGGLLAIIYGLRILAGIFLIMITHALSLRLRNHTLTLFISFAIGILPVLFAYGGLHTLDAISLVPMLQAGDYLTTGSGIAQLCGVSVFYAGCSIFAYRQIRKRLY